MKNIPTFDEFVNESHLSWKETRGVTVFNLRGTPYTLYKNIPMQKDMFELYKFDDDNGPLILRFKIENSKLVVYYGGFDQDAISRAYSHDILDAMFEYFDLPMNGSGAMNKNIIFKN